MTTESTFRAIALVSMALCLPIGVYHRIQSQATREKLARREEGLFILIGLRLCGFLAFLVLLGFLIDPPSVSWSSLALPRWLRWVGAAVSLLLLPALLFWTFHSLGKNLTDTVVTRREHTLVTHGPYRVRPKLDVDYPGRFRHPDSRSTFLQESHHGRPDRRRLDPQHYPPDHRRLRLVDA
jgi:protein-S-isoprenylcysteine O-methyltransferase Ste14